MVRRDPQTSASRSLRLHEPMAGGESEAGFGSSQSDRMGDQAADWIHRTMRRNGWPDFVFAFHEGDEIGPRMLARIAKHTGLSPEDL